MSKLDLVAELQVPGSAGASVRSTSFRALAAEEIGNAGNVPWREKECDPAEPGMAQCDAHGSASSDAEVRSRIGNFDDRRICIDRLLNGARHFWRHFRALFGQRMHQALDVLCGKGGVDADR